MNNIFYNMNVKFIILFNKSILNFVINNFHNPFVITSKFIFMPRNMFTNCNTHSYIHIYKCDNYFLLDDKWLISHRSFTERHLIEWNKEINLYR